jgi:hypothetical protein
MPKKITSLSDRLMPVEEQAAIPPRLTRTNQYQPGIASISQEMPGDAGKSKEKGVGLNFTVSPAFREEFRKFCHDRDLSLVRCLQRAFEALKEKESNHGA